MFQNKIFLISISLLFLLSNGCASTQNQSRFTENTFFCNNPNLKVRVLKNVVKQLEESKQGSGFKRIVHSYITDSNEVVGITIWRFRHTSSAEWRASDEQITRTIGMVPLGQISINKKAWVKFVDYNYEKYLAFGYFKRMGDNLVAVYCVNKNEKYKDEIASFKNTRDMTEKHKQLITKAFDYIEQLVVIE